MANESEGSAQSGYTLSKEERGKLEVQARMLYVNSKTESPEQRALKVYKAIKEKFGEEFSNWDLLCFSVEYIGSSVSAYPWLEELIKPVARHLYNAHYFLSETLGLF